MISISGREWAFGVSAGARMPSKKTVIGVRTARSWREWPAPSPGLAAAVAAVLAMLLAIWPVAFARTREFRTLDGALVCWGGNDYGQLGNASNARSLTPVLVQGLTSGALDVEAGGFTTCGVSSAGAALCWGYGFNGQLGNGGTADSTVPVAVSTLTSSITAVTIAVIAFAVRV